MINKNVIALGFVSFFTDMASSMITPILPLFIVYVLNEGVDKLGFIVAIATFVSYAFRILFGYLSDKYQVVKPFVVTGYLVSALTKPLLYFANTWQTIAGLRGIERMGKAIRSATKDSLISSYSDGKSGKTFGFHKTMDIAGELSGSIIAFFVLYHFGKSRIVFENIFAFTLIPGIIAVIIVYFFVKDAPYKKKETTFSLKDDYSLLPMLFIYFGFIFFMFNESFYIIKAKEAGFRIEYIPLLIVLLNFVQVMLSYFFGLKIDKVGAKKILFVSFLFGILSMMSLYFNFIIVGFVLLGIFTVASLNALRAYISVNALNKGTVYGILYGGVALSGALGAVAIGLVWKYFGESRAVIFSLTGLCLVILFSAIKLKGQR